MITLTDITDKWEAMLAANTPINDFCIEKYGQPLKILTCADRKRKIVDSDCPVCLLIPLSIDGGITSAEMTYNFLVFICVANKTIIVDGVDTEYKNTTQYGRINKLPGFREAETLVNLVWNVVAVANPSYPVNQVNTDINGTDHFPQFPGHMLLTVTVKNYRGANPTY